MKLHSIAIDINGEMANIAQFHKKRMQRGLFPARLKQKGIAAGELSDYGCI